MRSAVAVAELREERLDQRRLPDPRLAGHEDELSPPVERRREQRVQPRELGVAADQRSADGVGLGAGRAGARCGGRAARRGR